jgi:hypothetical protein
MGPEALAGVDGGPGNAPPVNDGSPAGVFAAEVHPLLTAKCTVCHEEGGIGTVLWGQDGEADDYDSTRANTALHGGYNLATATLITKGAHSGAVWWTPEQEASIGSWFDAEAAAQ